MATTPELRKVFLQSQAPETLHTPRVRQAFLQSRPAPIPQTPRVRQAFLQSIKPLPVTPRVRQMFGPEIEPLDPVWPFPPNWATSVMERLEWLTDIMPGFDDTEQRAQLRYAPRRFLVYQFLLEPWQLGRFDALTFGWQHRIFHLPIWQDCIRLEAAHTPPDLVVECDAEYRDFVAGQRAVFLPPDDGEEAYGTAALPYEVVEIDSVTATTVTLTQAARSAWPAGSRFLPVRDARLSQQVSSRRPSSDYATGEVTFEIIEEEEPAADLTGLTEYRGFDVLEVSRNRREDLDDSQTRAWFRVDSMTGIYSIQASSDHPILTRSFSWQATTREEVRTLKRWLSLRRGRLNPVWVLTDAHDLDLAYDMVSAEPIAVIKDVNARHLYGKNTLRVPDAPDYMNESRRDLAFIKPDGSMLFRRIESISKGPDGTEMLKLDSAPGENLSADTTRLQWLGLHRLSTDSIELEWITNEVVETVIGLRLL